MNILKRYRENVISRQMDDFDCPLHSLEVEKLPYTFNDPYVEQYEYKAQFVTIFSCKQDAFVPALRVAERQILRGIYGDIEALLPKLENAIHAGNRQKCFEIVGEIYKEVQP